MTKIIDMTNKAPEGTDVMSKEFAQCLVKELKKQKKRTEYYREWEAAHREERNAYRRKLYRLKKYQETMNFLKEN